MRVLTFGVLLILSFGNFVTAAETNKLLQKRLNELGFNAGTADGILGRKTKNALYELYQGRGLTFDGDIDRSEHDFVAYEHKLLLQKRYNFQFPDGGWKPEDIEIYNNKFVSNYHEAVGLFERSMGWYNDLKCETYLPKPHLMRDADTDAKVKKSNEWRKECLFLLPEFVSLSSVAYGQKSPILSLMYDKAFPIWFSTSSFVRPEAPTNGEGLFWYYSHQFNVAIMRIVATYIAYADYYGVEPKLDEQFATWFQEIDNRWAYRAGHPAYDKQCQEFMRDMTFEVMYCNNNAAEAAVTLAWAGAYLQNPEYLARALKLVDNISLHSLEGGITVDAMRSSAAPGYLIRTASAIDEVASVFGSLGFDIYSRKAGASSVAEIIEYAIAVGVNPEINYKYAKYMDGVYGDYNHKNVNWGGFDQSNDEMLNFRSTVLQSLARFVRKNPEMIDKYPELLTYLRYQTSSNLNLEVAFKMPILVAKTRKKDIDHEPYRELFDRLYAQSVSYRNRVELVPQIPADVKLEKLELDLGFDYKRYFNSLGLTEAQVPIPPEGKFSLNVILSKGIAGQKDGKIPLQLVRVGNDILPDNENSTPIFESSDEILGSIKGTGFTLRFKGYVCEGCDMQEIQIVGSALYGLGISKNVSTDGIRIVLHTID